MQTRVRENTTRGLDFHLAVEMRFSTELLPGVVAHRPDVPTESFRKYRSGFPISICTTKRKISVAELAIHFFSKRESYHCRPCSKQSYKRRELLRHA